MIKFANLFMYVLLIAISGCALDNDEVFFPETKAAVFLTADQSLYRIDENGLQPDWQNDLGISQVGDIGTDEKGIWVSDLSEKSVHFITNGNISEKKYSTAPLDPHHIEVGTDFILVGDTVQQVLGFLRKKKGDLAYQTPVLTKPGLMAYRSGKFYVQLGETQVGIYLEKAFALIDTLSFRARIVDMQPDNNSSVAIFTYDSVLHAAKIDYNTNQVNQAETPVTYQKALLTPNTRQRFGKEWLYDVLLENGTIFYSISKNNTDSVAKAKNFEVDFFEGQLYFQTADSLFVWDLDAKKQIWGFPFSQKITASHYKIEAKGE